MTTTTKTKRKRRKARTSHEKLSKAQAEVRRWTAEIARRQRAVKVAQKKLASAQRSERALIRAAEERASRPPERMDDDTLRARLRALRNQHGRNPAAALGHE